jgi:putative adhesin
MRHLTVLSVLLGLAAAAAPAGAAEATREIRAELPAVQSGRFVVENLSGSMRVVPGKGDRVIAVATIHAESEELARAVRFESVTTGRPRAERDMPTLRVRYPLDDDSILRRPGSRHVTLLVLPKWLSGVITKLEYDGRHVGVDDHQGVLIYADVEVQVPAREIEAIFRNFFGKLDGSDLEGRITFDTHGGDVSIGKSRGHLVADTGSGDVIARGIEGNLRCDTGSGSCRIDNFQGEDLTCDTGSGDVMVQGVKARRLRGDTGSGAIHVGSADLEEFVADTGSGDVSLEASSVARLRSIKADTGSGDVTLKLGPAASFEAIADQGSGDIVNRYGDAVPIVHHKELIGYRRGDGAIRIVVDTGSGDLTLAPGPINEARDRSEGSGSSRSR